MTLDHAVGSNGTAVVVALRARRDEGSAIHLVNGMVLRRSTTTEDLLVLCRRHDHARTGRALLSQREIHRLARGATIGEFLFTAPALALTRIELFARRI